MSWWLECRVRQAFETLLGPGKGDLKTESARSRVKAARDRTLSPKRDSATCCISTEAAGEAIDRMLAQDIFGAQQLLAYIRPTKSTKVTKALQKLPRLFQIGFFFPLRLAELFYIMDEEGGIVSQQRAAALLALAPGCGEAQKGGEGSDL